MAKIVGKYLTNAFSINMLPDANEAWYNIYIKKLTPDEFCSEIKNSNDIKNAVGHEGTAQIINQLCGTNLRANRTEIQLEFGSPDVDDFDESWKNVLYIVQVGTRLPEGKVLTQEELQKLLAEGKVKLLKLEITDLLGDILEYLTEKEEQKGEEED